MRFSFQFSRVFLILLWYAFPLWGALALLITLCGCLLALIDGLLIGDGIYAFLGMPLNGLIVALAVLAARMAVDKHGRLYSLAQSVEGRSFLDFEDTSNGEESEASA